MKYIQKIIIHSILFLSAWSVQAQNQAQMNLSVHFATNKSVMTAREKHKVDSFLQIVQSKENYTLVLSGHTDGKAGDEYNMKLSNKRVQQVYKYILAKGINKSTIEKKEYFGKRKPIAKNNSKQGRSQNRRVEITCYYQATPIAPPAPKENTDSINKARKALQDSLDLLAKKDDVVIFPEGTVLRAPKCAFAGIPFKDIVFEVRELYTKDAISKSGVQTVTTDGNCLITGGMLFIKATYKGKEIQPKCPIEISMPTENLDKDMRLFTASFDAVTGSNMRPWNLSTTNQLSFDDQGKTKSIIPQKVKDDNIYKKSDNYYMFTLESFGGFNCDKISGAYAKLTKATRKTFTFKVPKSTGNSINVFIGTDMHNIAAERINSKKFYFPEKCVGIQKVTATYFKNGKLMTCTREIKQLKKNRITKVYKFKKKWFTEVK